MQEEMKICDKLMQLNNVGCSETDKDISNNSEKVVV